MWGLGLSTGAGGVWGYKLQGLRVVSDRSLGL